MTQKLEYKIVIRIKRTADDLPMIEREFCVSIPDRPRDTDFQMMRTVDVMQGAAVRLIKKFV